MTNNKLLTALSVSLCMVAAQASAETMMSEAFTGPYIGVQAGYTTGDVDAGSSEYSVDGGDYGVYAGMKADALFNNTINRLGTSVTGAIEAHYNWSDADDSIGGTSLDKKNDWGISLRPGLGIIDEVLPVDLNPYGIIGYKRAEYAFNNGVTSSSEYFNGFELGVGTELLAYKQIGTRLEYSYTWFNEKDNVDPSDHSIRIGAAYHF